MYIIDCLFTRCWFLQVTSGDAGALQPAGDQRRKAGLLPVEGAHLRLHRPALVHLLRPQQVRSITKSIMKNVRSLKILRF